MKTHKQTARIPMDYCGMALMATQTDFPTMIRLQDKHLA